MWTGRNEDSAAGSRLPTLGEQFATCLRELALDSDFRSEVLEAAVAVAASFQAADSRNSRDYSCFVAAFIKNGLSKADSKSYAWLIASLYPKAVAEDKAFRECLSIIRRIARMCSTAKERARLLALMDGGINGILASRMAAPSAAHQEHTNPGSAMTSEPIHVLDELRSVLLADLDKTQKLQMAAGVAERIRSLLPETRGKPQPLHGLAHQLLHATAYDVIGPVSYSYDCVSGGCVDDWSKATRYAFGLSAYDSRSAVRRSLAVISAERKANNLGKSDIESILT